MRAWLAVFVLALLPAPLAAAAPTGTLAGFVVTADGEPVPGFVVEIFLGDSLIRHLESNATGHYEALLEEGCYRITVQPPVGLGIPALPYPDERSCMSVSPGSETPLILQYGWPTPVRGSVVHPNGTGALATLRAEGHLIETREDGSYHWFVTATRNVSVGLDRVVPNATEVFSDLFEAPSASCASSAFSVCVSSGQPRIVWQNFTLDALVPVTVRVHDEDGEVVPGAQLEVALDWPRPRFFRVSAAHGEAVVLVPPGDHAFQVVVPPSTYVTDRPPGCANDVRCSRRVAAPLELDFVVKGTTSLRGNARDAEGAPLVGTIEARPVQGVRLPVRSVVSEDGSYALSLVPAEYEVGFVPEAPTTSGPLVERGCGEGLLLCTRLIAGSTPQLHDFTMPRLRDATVSVLGRGPAVRDAQVQVSNAAYRAEATTDALGVARIKLPEGSYDVAVTAPPESPGVAFKPFGCGLCLGVTAEGQNELRAQLAHFFRVRIVVDGIPAGAMQQILAPPPSVFIVTNDSVELATREDGDSVGFYAARPASRALAIAVGSDGSWHAGSFVGEGPDLELHAQASAPLGCHKDEVVRTTCVFAFADGRLALVDVRAILPVTIDGEPVGVVPVVEIDGDERPVLIDEGLLFVWGPIIEPGRGRTWTVHPGGAPGEDSFEIQTVDPGSEKSTPLGPAALVALCAAAFLRGERERRRP